MRTAPANRSARNLGLVARYQRGDRTAAEELLSLNSGLVGRIAGRFLPFLCSLTFDDLCVEGQLGLLRAASTFDPTKAPCFSTFASIWIRQAIGRAIEQQDHMIRLPNHVIPRAEEMPRCDLSLDAPAGPDEEGRSLLERVAAPSDTEQAATDRVFSEWAYGQLTAREALVLRERLEGETLRAIGERIGVGREGARHSAARAVKKLRALCAAG